MKMLVCFALIVFSVSAQITVEGVGINSRAWEMNTGILCLAGLVGFVLAFFYEGDQ